MARKCCWRRAGWHLPLLYPLHAMLRDVLLPVLWVEGWREAGFVWRGNAMSLDEGDEAKPALRYEAGYDLRRNRRKIADRRDYLRFEPIPAFAQRRASEQFIERLKNVDRQRYYASACELCEGPADQGRRRRPFLRSPVRDRAAAAPDVPNDLKKQKRN